MSFFFFKKKTFMKFFYHFRKLVQIIWKRNILKKKEEEEERKMVEMISRIFCHFQETNSLWSRRFHLTIFLLFPSVKEIFSKKKKERKMVEMISRFFSTFFNGLMTLEGLRHMGDIETEGKQIVGVWVGGWEGWRKRGFFCHSDFTWN